MRFGDVLVIWVAVLVCAALVAVSFVVGVLVGGADLVRSLVRDWRADLARWIGGRWVAYSPAYWASVKSDGLVRGDYTPPVPAPVRPQPEPWKWDDRPFYISPGDWVAFVGTCDPLPDRGAAGVDGPSMLVGGRWVNAEVAAPPARLVADPAEVDYGADSPIVWCEDCHKAAPVWQLECLQCGLAIGLGRQAPTRVDVGNQTGVDVAEAEAAEWEDRAPGQPRLAPVVEQRTRKPKAKAERMPFPSVKQLAAYLAVVKRGADWADMGEEGEDGAGWLDVRLNVQPDGWTVNTGDPSYDLDHRGVWGCGAMSRRTNCRELAAELIGEARDDLAERESAERQADAAALVSGAE